MKTRIHFALVLILSGIVFTSYSQNQEPVTKTPTSSAPAAQRVTDQMVTDKLSKDLSSRNSATQNKTINWYQNNYGYTAKYAVGSASFISRYDNQGNYVETLRKTEWSNATVPAVLANAYSQSSFKDQTIAGYWTVTDPGKSGYYLELQDKSGVSSSVWADSQGRFTTLPYSSTISTPGSIPKD